MYTEVLQDEVVFVYPLLKRHVCPICLHAMRSSPVQTECGHLFCKECLDPVLRRRRPICPLDKEAISRVSHPIIMYYQIKVDWLGLYFLKTFGGCMYYVTLSLSSGISGQSVPKRDSLPAGLLQLQGEWVFMDWSPERPRCNIMQQVTWMYAFLACRWWNSVQIVHSIEEHEFRTLISMIL